MFKTRNNRKTLYVKKIFFLKTALKVLLEKYKIYTRINIFMYYINIYSTCIYIYVLHTVYEALFDSINTSLYY